MKIKRQTKIIELIMKNDVETQEELADLLNEAGYNVTQATISRDIRELKLTKVPAEKGKQKYIVLQKQEVGLSEKFVRVLRDGFLSMDRAQNIMVIKTVSGMAMAVAAALDALHINGIVGCIAGDDTIMCAIRSVEDTIEVMEKVNKLVSTRNDDIF
ncbi:MAG TPA: arginine repressor [Lachnospiraceae bacterium]|jgi:transcriptional regulator of arginine metabolism|nr:arginine repressor [Lachnospiraceae bacterium]HEX3076684.1 arginine repressor [Lachnospiraceae bacterium]